MAGEVERLQEFVDKYDNIVFFGGAGVSTESGIPDFRSQDGLYHQKYDYPPETILSHTFFMRKPEEFFKFYRDKMLCDTSCSNCGIHFHEAPAPSYCLPSDVDCRYSG